MGLGPIVKSPETLIPPLIDRSGELGWWE